MSPLAALSTLLLGALCAASCGGTRVEPSATSASALASSAPIPSASGSSDPAAMHSGPLDAESLMAEARWLASKERHGRGSASPDEARVAVHLAKALDDALVERIGENKARTQSFDAARPTAPLRDNAQVTQPSSKVFGEIRATNSRFKDEVIVLGAHFDHLGELNGKTYFGADDNASGVAAVLGIAKSLMSRRSELGRDVVVVFFGAEEIGMRGSAAFAQNGPVPSRLMAAMVNVDMIGRPLSDQPLLRAAERFVGIDPEASVGVDGLRDRPIFMRIVREACHSEKHVAVTIDDLSRGVAVDGRRSFARSRR